MGLALPCSLDRPRGATQKAPCAGIRGRPDVEIAMVLVTADDQKLSDEFESQLEELDGAATKIQSAYRGRKARASLVPKQRRLRSRVDKNIVREVTEEEENEARAEAATMVESGEWRYAKVARFTLAEGGKLWMCSDETLRSDAVRSQAVVTVEPTRTDLKPPNPTYRALLQVRCRQHFDAKSAVCGELEEGEIVTVLEMVDVDPPKRKRKVKANNAIALRSGTPNTEPAPEPEPELEPDNGDDEIPFMDVENKRMRFKFGARDAWANIWATDLQETQRRQVDGQWKDVKTYREQQFELVAKKPGAVSDVVVVSVRQFTCDRPLGIPSDRAIVSPFIRALSLPGAWNAAFSERNGVSVRLPHCCASLRSLQVHWQPEPINPYNPAWETLEVDAVHEDAAEFRLSSWVAVAADEVLAQHPEKHDHLQVRCVKRHAVRLELADGEHSADSEDSEDSEESADSVDGDHLHFLEKGEMLRPLDVLEAAPPLREKRRIKKDEFGKVLPTKDVSDGNSENKRPPGKLEPFPAAGVVADDVLERDLAAFRAGLSRAEQVDALEKKAWKKKCMAQGHAGNSVLTTQDIDKLVELERSELITKRVKQEIVNAVDREQILKVFREFDADDSGSLSYSEFQLGLKHMGLNLNEEEFNLLTTEVDNDGGGSIDFDEFVEDIAPELVVLTFNSKPVVNRKVLLELPGGVRASTTVYGCGLGGAQQLEWMKYVPRPGNFVATCPAAQTEDRVWVYYTVPTESQAAVEEDADNDGIADLLGHCRLDLNQPARFSFQFVPFQLVDQEVGTAGLLVGQLCLTRGRWYRLEMEKTVRRTPQETSEGAGGANLKEQKKWAGRCAPGQYEMSPKGPSESRRWIGQGLIKMEMFATVRSSDQQAALAANQGRQFAVRMKLVATDSKVVGTETSGGSIAQVIHVPLQIRSPIDSPPSTPPDRRAPLMQMVGKASPELHPFGLPRSTDASLESTEAQHALSLPTGVGNNDALDEDDAEIELESEPPTSAHGDCEKEDSQSGKAGCCRSWRAMLGLGKQEVYAAEELGP